MKTNEAHLLNQVIQIIYESNALTRADLIMQNIKDLIDVFKTDYSQSTHLEDGIAAWFLSTAEHFLLDVLLTGEETSIFLET